MNVQSDLIAALNEIEDPELGIGIVDLGLVYRAEWSETGIDVEFTMTATSCPFSETIVARAEEILRQRFRDAASIRVQLVWEPLWTVDRLSDAARRKLGWLSKPTAPAPSMFGVGRIFDPWKH